MKVISWSTGKGVIGLAAVALAAAACGTSGASPSGSGTSSGPIKIGLIAPLTGTYADAGVGNVQGVTLAVAAINAAGGIGGRKIQVVTENDNTVATTAVDAFYKLVSDHVAGIIGPLDNTSANAVAPLAERQGIPEIVPTSDPTISEPPQKFVFESVPVPADIGLPIVQYLAASGMKKVAIAYDTTTSFSTSGYQSTVSQARARGISVTASYPFQASTTDFSPILAKLKNGNASAFLVWGGGPAEVSLTKQYAAAGLRQKIPLIFTIAEATNTFISPVGSAGDGIYMDASDAAIASYLPNNSPYTKMISAFAGAYAKRYGGAPAQFATDAYAAAQILFAAMKAAGNISPAAIGDALNQLSVLTVDGSYHFTPTQHGSVYDANNEAMVQLQGGKLVPVPWEKTRYASLPS